MTASIILAGLLSGWSFCLSSSETIPVSSGAMNLGDAVQVISLPNYWDDKAKRRLLEKSIVLRDTRSLSRTDLIDAIETRIPGINVSLCGLPDANLKIVTASPVAHYDKPHPASGHIVAAITPYLEEKPFLQKGDQAKLLILLGSINISRDVTLLEDAESKSHVHILTGDGHSMSVPVHGTHLTLEEID